MCKILGIRIKMRRGGGEGGCEQRREHVKRGGGGEGGVKEMEKVMTTHLVISSDEVKESGMFRMRILDKEH